ncbi:MAG: hypothetical protein STHCBS139747_000075 [Sporothrix thermara]
MERRKKVSISAVLALGSIASIASISTLEIGIALTASSLATLTPLFRKIKFFSSS